MKLLPYNHGYNPSLISDEILSAGIETNLGELGRIYVSIQESATQIAESDEHTKIGKVKALQALGEESRIELNKWRSQFHYDEMITQLTAEMTPTRSNPENSVAESRMRDQFHLARVPRNLHNLSDQADG